MNAQPLLLALLASCLGIALPAQTEYKEFVKNFDQALKFNNADGLTNAIKSKPGMAISHFENLMVSKLRSVDDQARYTEPLAKLKAGFLKVFETNTLDQVERYYERLKPDRINKLYEAERNRGELYNQWLKVNQDRDRKGVLQLVGQGEQLGRYVEELGHKLKAADVYSTIATFMDRIPNHTAQDTQDTIAFAKMFMRSRDSWGWNKDPTYMQWKNWVHDKTVRVAEDAKKAEVRKKDGLDDEAEGLGNLVDGKGVEETGKLVFTPLKELPKQDSCFLGGGVPVNWLATRIETGKGAAKMFYFKKRDVYLMRDGLKLNVSLSGRDGEPSVRVDASAKPKPSMIYLEPGNKDPYAMAFFIGSAQEPFAGAISNVAPTKEAMSVYYRSASSWVTTLHGEEITFYDDNTDGLIFTKDPLEYGFKTRLYGGGVEEDKAVPVYDSMKIGKKGQIVPFSTAAKIGDKWFFFEAADGGKAVTAKPMHPKYFETGRVKMKWSGSRAVKPQLLILRGRDNLQATAFNIAGKKAVEVPAGEYEIAYGRASKGKGAQTQMVHIFRGDSELIKVEKDKETVVKLGGPFKFDFEKGGDETNVEIDSLSFRILGIAGEVYGKIQGPIPGPEVIVAKTSSGKGAKVVGNYIGISTPELLNTAAKTLGETLAAKNIRGMGVNVAYFPINKKSKEASTVVKFKVPFVGALVGLRLKKHKLFGKMESVFK